MAEQRPKFCLSRAKVWYEGEGAFILEAGNFVYHSPRHLRDLMDYSDDLEPL